MLVTLLSLAIAAPLSAIEGDALRSTEGWLIVDVTKDAACDSDAFDSEAVAAWLAPDGRTATRIDRTQQPKVAKDLFSGGYDTTPVRFAFKDGEPVDRLCGCVTEADLAAWLDGLAEGRTAASTLRGRLPTEDLEVRGLLDVVSLDYCAHRLDDAYATLKQLWEQIPERAIAYQNVRNTRVASDLGVLVAASEEAAADLESVRDAAGERKDEDPLALDDWVLLNRILGNDDLTLEWFLAEAGGDGRERHAANVFYMFAERGRWEDAGRAVLDPAEMLRAWKKVPGGVEQAVWAWSALLKAGRTKDAKDFEKRLLNNAPAGTQCQMVAQAATIDVAHPSQRKLTKTCPDDVVMAWKLALARR